MGIKEIMAARKAAASVTTESVVAPVETVAEPVVAEPTILPAKTLTFAEKMLEKKRLAALAKEVPPKEEVVPAVKETAPTLTNLAKAVTQLEPTFDSGSWRCGDSETEQAYMDIKARIDQLVELSEEPLADAMTELKKALMKNPAAVSLMLDSDIGQMVIALRKMTHVAASEAVKPGKKGPKAKQVTLSAEALEAAFDEM